MKNHELDNFLKNAPTPDWPAEHWEGFPSRVIARLKCKTANTPAQTQKVFGLTTSPFLVWSMRLAAVCMVLGLAFGLLQKKRTSTTEQELAQARKYLLELRELFPGQLRAIALDYSGPRLILAESRIVADSQPVYVKVQGERGSQTFITFSGQQIRVNGHEFEVLIQAHGGVLLIGESGVFVSGGTKAQIGALRIEAYELNHDT